MTQGKDNAAILIEGLSKSYERGKVRKADIRSSLSSLLEGGGIKREFFFALKDINLQIERGDVVGIIGPNGAGKSTLLKLLSRITFPTEGKIKIRGTLSSMLEVGTGFHPELTGRENIYLNGSIIGMKREEVNRKLDSIVSFSGIESFLDTPVKHYSSGMYVRLAFSVAAHLEPDILLIDEVLAVGDHEFRRKCLDKLLDVSSQGRTIMMVSHQMSYLKELCKSGVYIDSGRLVYYGAIDETINHYVSQNEFKNIAVKDRVDRRGSGLVMVRKFEMLDEKHDRIVTIFTGQSVVFSLELEAAKEVFNVVIQMEFYDLFGHLWFVANNNMSGNSISSMNGTKKIECNIPKFPLNANSYFINVAVYVQNKLSDEVTNAFPVEVVPGLYYQTGRLPPSNRGFLVEYQWSEK